MSKQQSTKSKVTRQMQKKVTRIYEGKTIEWEGEGIYLFHMVVGGMDGGYYKIKDLGRLEFAMKHGKTPVYIKEDEVK